jgi:hypothetical protein
VPNPAFLTGSLPAASAVAPSPYACSPATCAQNFVATGAAQTFTVRTGVTSVVATVSGAQGGNEYGFGQLEAAGGSGGTTTATLVVTPT